MTSTTRLRRKLRRKLSREYECPMGGSGVYVKISSNKGIKLSRYSTIYPNGGNFKECCENAQKEASNLKRARRLFPYIPECYGVKVVRVKDGYRVGIVMQHVGNMRFDSLPKKLYNTLSENNIFSNIQSSLSKAGIDHNDIHGNNIMYYKHKLWVIDFGSVYFTKET